MFQKHGEVTKKLDTDKLREEARRVDGEGSSTHDTRPGGTCISFTATGLLFVDLSGAAIGAGFP